MTTAQNLSPVSKSRLEALSDGLFAIYAARGKEDRLSQWVISIATRRHPNVAAVALANKTARIAWAMLRHE